jgi:hypothetical protein
LFKKKEKEEKQGTEIKKKTSRKLKTKALKQKQVTESPKGKKKKTL